MNKYQKLISNLLKRTAQVTLILMHVMNAERTPRQTFSRSQAVTQEIHRKVTVLCENIFLNVYAWLHEGAVNDSKRSAAAVAAATAAATAVRGRGAAAGAGAGAGAGAAVAATQSALGEGKRARGGGSKSNPGGGGVGTDSSSNGAVCGSVSASPSVSAQAGEGEPGERNSAPALGQAREVRRQLPTVAVAVATSVGGRLPRLQRVGTQGVGVAIGGVPDAAREETGGAVEEAGAGGGSGLKRKAEERDRERVSE